MWVSCSTADPWRPRIPTIAQADEALFRLWDLDTETKFNRQLSRARFVTENAFGRLKGR